LLCIGESGHRWSPFFSWRFGGGDGDLQGLRPLRAPVCAREIRLEGRGVGARRYGPAESVSRCVFPRAREARIPTDKLVCDALDLTDEWEVVGMIADLNGATHPVVMTWIVERGGPPRLTSTWVDVP
jgi:hypothetical protein